jgi:agmatine/peptidylarginine deiminase
MKYRKEKTYPDIVCDAIGLKTVKSDLILDGGNIIKGKNKVILTDKIIPENAHKHLKVAVIRKLEELFEVNEVILIPWLENDMFGHADGMIRFLDEDNVIIDGYHKHSKSPRSQKFLSILEKHGLHEHFIEFQKPRQGNHNWGYVNFLQTGNILVLPYFGIDEDEQAFRTFEEWFPAYAKSGRLISLNASSIIKNGGALNCISWNILREQTND